MESQLIRRKSPFAVFDVARSSLNLGDHVISEAVFSELGGLRTSEKIDPFSRSYGKRAAIRSSERVVYGGTNVLWSSAFFRRPWRLYPFDIMSINQSLIMAGVGWRAYEGSVGKLAGAVYRRVLDPSVPVSTRDQYSADKLTAAGIRSINTSCITMWQLADVLPASSFSHEVVITVTDYRPDALADRAWIEWVLEHFSDVLFWPQGQGDLAYLRSLNLPRPIAVLDRSLDAYNRSIQGRTHIGTRLHAGIRASQLGNPSLVLSVDNRATEISRDTNYPVVSRSDVFRDPELLGAVLSTVQLRIPRAAIAKWRSQVPEEMLGDDDDSL